MPKETTEIAMFPVAWTKGLDFKPAPRTSSREITYFDSYGMTFENGPAFPFAFSNGPGVAVDVDIVANKRDVWDLMSDINFANKFSNEFVGANWDQESPSIKLGDTFTGRNQNEHIGEWTAKCTIDALELGRLFGWCTGDISSPGARWRYELFDLGGTVRVRHRVILGPGNSGLTRIIAENPQEESKIIRNRLYALRQNMEMVLDGMKSSLED